MTAHQAALEALTRYFGYDSFRPGQQGIVEALLAGRDVLGVMPTGAGKSVCYQIPAALSPGMTLVISPLISLMRDQVDALNDLGLPAAFINTTQTPDEQAMVFAQAAAGQIKLLYVAPERLETGRFRDFAARTPISLIAVDEAHCVSQWGQDFRSSYLGIGDFIAGLPQRPPVGAFTATATERVRRDIVGLLGLRNPAVTVTGFDRPNLYFDVVKLETKYKAAWVARYVADHPDESGIVYCATRKTTEALTDTLNQMGHPAVAYHGGMSPDAREAPPTLSAWASISPTCVTSSTTICPNPLRPTIRRPAARAVTASPADARCCGMSQTSSPGVGCWITIMRTND